MNTTVVLVAHYGDAWLGPCLASLAEASTQRLHLVLLDNFGNTTLDALDVGAFDTEILRTTRPLGFAEANNFALVRAARLEGAILFLNQDTLGRPGWVDECLGCFAEEEGLGALSPVIRTYDWSAWDTDFLAFVAASGQQPQLAEDSASGGAWFEVKNAPAPALLVRRDVLERTGPFDPVFGSYYEDADLCRRVRRLGYRVGFCRTATIAHYNGSTTTDRAKERRRARLIVRNQVIYQLRESDGPRWPRALRFVLRDFPRRLIRGLVRTSSSQPPTATLKAYGDLLRIVDRLVSRRRDEAAWTRALQEMGWPDRVPGLRQPADEGIDPHRLHDAAVRHPLQ
jgi:hypothetical protein